VQRSLLVLIASAATLLMSGCNNLFQTREDPPPTLSNTIRDAFVKAGVTVHDVEVKVNLPTNLPVKVVPTVEPKSGRANFAGVPEGSYTFAYAVHYRKVIEDGEEGFEPVILGATVVHPWSKQVQIDVESTALYLALYHWGMLWHQVIDPEKLGVSRSSQDLADLARDFYEKLELAAKSQPEFADLKREIEGFIRQGRDLFEDAPLASQDGYEPQAAVPVVGPIVVNIGRLILTKLAMKAAEVAGLLVRSYSSAEALLMVSQIGEYGWRKLLEGRYPFDVQLVRGPRNEEDRLIIESKNLAPIAVGLLDYETESDTPYEATLSLPSVFDLFASKVSGSSPPNRAEFSLKKGRYLGCVVGPQTPLVEDWNTTNGSFPVQDLFSSLERKVDIRLQSEYQLTYLSNFMGTYGLNLVLNFFDLFGIEFLQSISKDIDDRLRDLDRLINPENWRAKDARWKKPEYEYLRKFAAELVKVLGVDSLKKDGSLDLRKLSSFKAVVGVAKMQISALKGLGFLARILLIGTNIPKNIPKEIAVKALLSTIFRGLYLAPEFLSPIPPTCYEIDTEKGLLRKTSLPNIAVSPREIVNGKKDTPYQFTVKVLHMVVKDRTNKFDLEWNFGDGTAGQRDIIATRSPHTEFLTHAYRNAGAYGALFQATFSSSKASQVVPVYIELPKNENNYNLNICDVWRAANSGGYGVTEDLWDISVIRPPSGQKAVFDISFNTYSIPDRIFVYYPPGNLVLDTGWRGDPSYQGDPLYPGGIAGPGRGQFNDIFEKGSVDQFKVVVVGPDRDTAWTYSVRCRFVQSSSQPQALGVTLEPREVPLDPEALRQFPVLREGR
jgi:hypothetical protein